MSKLLERIKKCGSAYGYLMDVSEFNDTESIAKAMDEVDTVACLLCAKYAEAVEKDSVAKFHAAIDKGFVSAGDYAKWLHERPARPEFHAAGAKAWKTFNDAIDSTD